MQYTVALINDDPGMLRLLARLLTQEGYGVVSHEDAGDALGFMSATNPPDLIITDLDMPGINGWQLCRLLRSPEYGPFNRIPILVVSGKYLGDEVESLTADAGADAFLPWPLRKEQLSETIRSLLSGVPIRQPGRVLVIEEDAALREAYATAFEKNGYRATVSPPVSNVLPLFEADTFDMVVLQCDTPDSPGERFLTAFHTARPDTVIMLTTTESSPGQLLTWLRAGATAWLRNPVDPEHLVAACREGHREKAALSTAARLATRTRQLREREAFFQAAIQNAPVFTFAVNAQGIITLCEGRALAGMGLLPGQLLGVSAFEYFKDHHEVNDALHHALRGECAYCSCILSETALEVSCAPIGGGMEAITGAIAVASVITDNARYEGALHARDEQLRGIAASIPGVVYQLRVRPGSIMDIIYAEGRVEHYLGDNPDKKQFLALFLAHMSPDDQDQLMNTAREATASMLRWDYEARYKRPNDEWIWFRSISEPHRSGEDVIFNGILIDTTTERLAEEKRASAEFLLEAAIKHSPSGILIADAPSGTIRFTNPAALGIREASLELLTGIEIEQHSAAWQTFFPDGTPYPSEELPLSRAILRGEVTRNEEVIIRNASGEDRWVSVNAAPVLDGEGNITAGIVVFQDITERRLAVESLRHSREQLLRHNEAIVTLMTGGLLSLGDLSGAIARVTETCSELLKIERVSVWLYESDQETLLCVDLYERSNKRHTSGEKLCSKGFPSYTRSHQHGKVIATRDVFTDPITCEIPASYFIEHDIRSLLDAPIWLENRIGGVLCLEHTVEQRDWSIEEERMATTMATLLTLCHEISGRMAMEESLRKSEERNRAIVSALPDILFRLDADCRIIDFHTGDISALAVSPDRFIGQMADSFTPPELAPKIRESIAKALSGQITQSFTYSMTVAGEDRFFETRIVACGKQEVLAIIRDTTSAHHSEDLLRLNAERTQVLLRLNQMTEAPLSDITAYALEEGIRLTRSRFGYLAFMEEDENVLVMYSWSESAMIECEIQDKPVRYPVNETGLWSEAVRQRRPVITNDYAAPNPWRKGQPEGHIPIKRHMNVPVIAEGRITLVAGVGNKDSEYDENDVQQLTLLMEGMWRLVERKRTFEALNESQNRLQFAMDLAQLAYWEYDVATDKYSFDDRLYALLGTTAEKEGGSLIPSAFYAHEFFPPDEADTIARENAFALASPEPVYRRQLEHHVIRRDGKEGYLLVRFQTWRDETGRVAKLYGSNQDITWRKQAEIEREKVQAQLVQAQKMESVGRLAGGVAHDFNNMLGAIIGYTELAMQELPPDHPVRPDLYEILNAAKRSADLTRQLLAFARKQTVAPKILDLNTLISGTLRMLQRLIGEDIRLDWRPGPALWNVCMDPGQMDQVLANLSVNARDAINGVGMLTIQTANTILTGALSTGHEDIGPGEYVLVTVSDTGAGMDEETITRIFEPFFTTKDIGKGTGLGLATVYGVIRQNNGGVRVSSIPAKGTTFQIYLPRVQSDVPEILAPDEPDPRGSETILLVEDEAAIRNVAKSILEEHGYHVYAAASPSEALSLARLAGESLHLLITDVIMPEMNGRDLMERLMLIRPGLKCLFISGYTADVISHHGVLGDGVNFLQKPFSGSVLARKTREAIDHA